MKVDGLGWLGIRTERFEEAARFFREVMGLEETRRERNVVGFAFPDGTEIEVWRPDDEFYSFFGAGPVVGFLVDDVEAARTRMEAAGVGSLGPIQHSEGLPGATPAVRTATSTRSSASAEIAVRRYPDRLRAADGPDATAGCRSPRRPQLRRAGPRCVVWPVQRSRQRL